MFSRRFKLPSRAVGAAAMTLAMSGGVLAQEGPNTGAVSVASGVDVLPGTTYVFRGIVQESEPKLTLWPYGDLGLAVFSGGGAVKSVDLNIGVWNSLHTGTSGSGGASDRIHYEEDFYTSLSLGFGGDLSVAATFTAYTSPNIMFNTVREISVKVSQGHPLAPYGLVGFELSGQADGGANEGTYLELGIGPSWEFAGGGASLAVPIRVGLSLNGYYEGPTGDTKFGFFDVGGLMTVPLAGIPRKLGSWNVHGGLDVLVFGDTTKAFNNGDGSKVVGLFGIGLSY